VIDHRGIQLVLDREHAGGERSGVSPGFTGTRRCAMMRPRSYSSSTRWTVAPVSRSPASATALVHAHAVHPLPTERRKERRMDVQDAVG
jgi:hypothetical protein